LIIFLTALALVLPMHQERTCDRPSSWKIHHQLDIQYPQFKRALVIHFGSSWKEAAIVSWGEGSWHWNAKNGQYLGTFQMGSRERAIYGHSNTLAGQVAAASRYWRASGRDWSPWSCKP
jgi:hypothetical protein